ncbi:hypothetical protein M0813_16723 [Anaeramoeba flamelloides]|uniref:Uncharacterized protein n=1 Tax=Anaeramoeba flamelloides TaxID=1746091 RepID=A0ABQ8YZH2_9EUKA|nr:hypothetical protein M0813_16723 [Anaeramoeba flamelloides]
MSTHSDQSHQDLSIFPPHQIVTLDWHPSPLRESHNYLRISGFNSLMGIIFGIFVLNLAFSDNDNSSDNTSTMLKSIQIPEGLMFLQPIRVQLEEQSEEADEDKFGIKKKPIPIPYQSPEY